MMRPVPEMTTISLQHDDFAHCKMSLLVALFTADSPCCLLQGHAPG